jgi:hypothetical protein
MKEYNKPIMIEEELQIVDVIAQSFGDDLPGDREITDFWS